MLKGVAGSSPFHFTNTGDPSHPLHTQLFCSLSFSLTGHVWVGGSIKPSGGKEGREEEGLMYICMREGAKKSDARNNAVGLLVSRPSQTGTKRTSQCRMCR